MRYLERPIPALASLLVAAAILPAVPWPIPRALAGAILFVVLPGCLVLGVLWPGPDRPSRAWLLGMTLPAGMAVTGVLLLLAHYGGWYGFRTFVAAAASLNGALVIANALCEGRRSCTLTRRRVSLSLARPRRPDLILVAAGLVFLLALVYAASAPRVGEPPTEFYVLTPSGELPFSLPPAGRSPSSQVTLVVGVRNGEGRPAAFEVVARARRDTGPVTLGTLPVHLLAGEWVEVPLVLTLPHSEMAVVDIALYLPGDRATPHRWLTVPVAVD